MRTHQHICPSMPTMGPTPLPLVLVVTVRPTPDRAPALAPPGDASPAIVLPLTGATLPYCPLFFWNRTLVLHLPGAILPYRLLPARPRYARPRQTQVPGASTPTAPRPPRPSRPEQVYCTGRHDLPSPVRVTTLAAAEPPALPNRLCSPQALLISGRPSPMPLCDLPTTPMYLSVLVGVELGAYVGERPVQPPQGVHVQPLNGGAQLAGHLGPWR